MQHFGCLQHKIKVYVNSKMHEMALPKGFIQRNIENIASCQMEDVFAELRKLLQSKHC